MRSLAATTHSSMLKGGRNKLHTLQVVSAANIVGAGHGLEVGRSLELLTIRQAEAQAEQAHRLLRLGPRTFQRPTADQALMPPATAMQVCTLL